MVPLVLTTDQFVHTSFEPHFHLSVYFGWYAKQQSIQSVLPLQTCWSDGVLSDLSDYSLSETALKTKDGVTLIMSSFSTELHVQPSPLNASHSLFDRMTIMPLASSL